MDALLRPASTMSRLILHAEKTTLLQVRKMTHYSASDLPLHAWGEGLDLAN